MTQLQTRRIINHKHHHARISSTLKSKVIFRDSVFFTVRFFNSIVVLTNLPVCPHAGIFLFCQPSSSLDDPSGSGIVEVCRLFPWPQTAEGYKKIRNRLSGGFLDTSVSMLNTHRSHHCTATTAPIIVITGIPSPCTGASSRLLLPLLSMRIHLLFLK